MHRAIRVFPLVSCYLALPFFGKEVHLTVNYIGNVLLNRLP